MKRVRVRVTPDPASAPRPFRLLADSPTIEETRLLEWNPGTGRRPTMLFAVDGDDDGLCEELEAAPLVDQVDRTPVADRRSVLLVTLRPDATPLTAAMFEAVARSGVVVNLPVVYREGAVHATLVGESAALQSMLDALPPAVTIAVEDIGGFEGDSPSSILSHRQREAMLVGLELGYYDIPRAATHRDVAARLGCAPSTASEHLQKAEAKLVRAVMEEPEP